MDLDFKSDDSKQGKIVVSKAKSEFKIKAAKKEVKPVKDLSEMNLAEIIDSRPKVERGKRKIKQEEKDNQKSLINDFQKSEKNTVKTEKEK